jgi:hypothetical protein
VFHLILAFGYDAVATSGCDCSSVVLMSFLLCSAHNRALELTSSSSLSPPLQRDGCNLYMTMHGHKVDYGPRT